MGFKIEFVGGPLCGERKDTWVTTPDRVVTPYLVNGMPMGPNVAYARQNERRCPDGHKRVHYVYQGIAEN